jgi:uncharacterized iron-regulated membrane protein
MALSMDEQRVLAEIERRLAAEDPGLAACMTSFRRPGPAAVLRSPRARIIGSLFTVLLVAMISLMVYAMIPFRAHGTKAPAGQPGTIPRQTQISANGAGAPGQSGTVTVRASTPGVRQARVTNASATTRNASGKKTSSLSAATRGRSAPSGKTSATPQAQGTKAKTAGT